MSFTERSRRVPAVGLGLALTFLSPLAGAYCRTTTCDPKHEACASEDGCIVEGHPLYWREKCLSFGAQQDGSPLRGISYEVAHQAFQTAFLQWSGVDCGGKPPSFRMWDLGPIVCAEPEFNDLLPNANTWIFRDTSWPYEGQTSTLALTTVLFEKSTGVILDADVEINSLNIPITVSDTEVDRDLQAIATHEAGHFLGLSHSKVTGATMSATYNRRNLDYRSLARDDTAGICEIYPPGREASQCNGPHPAHGFSRYCGGGETDTNASTLSCEIQRGGNSRGAGALLSGLAVAALSGIRLRRRRVRSQS